MPELEIDTLNRWLIGSTTDRIVIGRPPATLSPDAALVFAAYLVAMAEPFARHRFAAVLQAVKSC